MASKFYGAIGTSGGTDGFLDNIDGTNLNNLDGAIVITTDPYAGFYTLDSDNGGSQAIPSLMQPDANASSKMWWLAQVQATGFRLYDKDTTNLTTIDNGASGDVLVDVTTSGATFTVQGENSGNATMIVADPAASVELYEANAKKFETSGTGATVTGVLVADGLTMGDNEPIKLGAGPDAEIESNGTALVIGSGASENMIIATPNAAVDLYYNNSKKFETTNTGATVTGVLVSDGFTLGDSENLLLSTDAKLGSNGTNAVLQSGASENMIVACPNGAVELYHNNVKTAETNAEGLWTVGSINFPDTQNASSDVNSFDDYKEGTWTPTAADAAASGNTTTTGTGHYTKMGNVVNAWGSITSVNTTGMTASNDFHVQGLPYTPNSAIEWPGSVMVRGVNTTASCVHICAYVDTNETAVQFREVIDNSSSWPTINVSQVTDDSNAFKFHLTYHV